MAVTGARAAGRHQLPQLRLARSGPEAFWQLQEGVRGLGDACRALGLPITGGNVSLYNESAADGRHRTHLPGGRGRAAGRHRPRGSGPCPAARARSWSRCWVRRSPGMAGSIYVDIAGPGPDDRPPELDLAAHAALLGLLRAAAEAGPAARPPRT